MYIDKYRSTNIHRNVTITTTSTTHTRTPHHTRYIERALQLHMLMIYYDQLHLLACRLRQMKHDL